MSDSQTVSFLPEQFKIKCNYFWHKSIFLALSEQNIFMFVKYKNKARKFCSVSKQHRCGVQPHKCNKCHEREIQYSSWQLLPLKSWLPQTMRSFLNLLIWTVAGEGCIHIYNFPFRTGFRKYQFKTQAVQKPKYAKFHDCVSKASSMEMLCLGALGILCLAWICFSGARKTVPLAAESPSKQPYPKEFWSNAHNETKSCIHSYDSKPQSISQTFSQGMMSTSWCH